VCLNGVLDSDALYLRDSTHIYQLSQNNGELQPVYTAPPDLEIARFRVQNDVIGFIMGKESTTNAYLLDLTTLTVQQLTDDGLTLIALVRPQ
jgi:hypothetical protein